eukprot:33878_1
MNQVLPLWNNVTGWKDMVDIQFVPYGKCTQSYNSQQNKYEFNCQHGPNECADEIFQGCYINITNNNPELYLPFSYKVTTAMYNSGNKWCGGNAQQIAQNACNEITECNWNDLLECYNGPLGNAIMHQNGLFTVQNGLTLNGTVPYIIVNNIYNQNEDNFCEYNLLNCTCSYYKGQNPACN